MGHTEQCLLLSNSTGVLGNVCLVSFILNATSKSQQNSSGNPVDVIEKLQDTPTTSSLVEKKEGFIEFPEHSSKVIDFPFDTFSSAFTYKQISAGVAEMEIGDFVQHRIETRINDGVLYKNAKSEYGIADSVNKNVFTYNEIRKSLNSDTSSINSTIEVKGKFKNEILSRIMQNEYLDAEFSVIENTGILIDRQIPKFDSLKNILMNLVGFKIKKIIGLIF